MRSYVNAPQLLSVVVGCRIMASPNTVARLSADAWLGIAFFLSPDDLLQLSVVSQDVRAVVTSNGIWEWLWRRDVPDDLRVEAEETLRWVPSGGMPAATEPLQFMRGYFRVLRFARGLECASDIIVLDRFYHTPETRWRPLRQLHLLLTGYYRTWSRMPRCVGQFGPAMDKDVQPLMCRWMGAFAKDSAGDGDERRTEITAKRLNRIIGFGHACRRLTDRRMPRMLTALAWCGAAFGMSWLLSSDDAPSLVIFAREAAIGALTTVRNGLLCMHELVTTPLIWPSFFAVPVDSSARTDPMWQRTVQDIIGDLRPTPWSFPAAALAFYDSHIATLAHHVLWGTTSALALHFAIAVCSGYRHALRLPTTGAKYAYAALNTPLVPALLSIALGAVAHAAQMYTLTSPFIVPVLLRGAVQSLYCAFLCLPTLAGVVAAVVTGDSYLNRRKMDVFVLGACTVVAVVGHIARVLEARLGVGWFVVSTAMRAPPMLIAFCMLDLCTLALCKHYVHQYCAYWSNFRGGRRLHGGDHADGLHIVAESRVSPSSDTVARQTLVPVFVCAAVLLITGSAKQAAAASTLVWTICAVGRYVGRVLAHWTRA
jgi:hypothetical protein